METFQMDVNKQSQNAGDYSQQVQAGTINIYNGITEQRAREIYSEMSKKAIADNTSEAYEIANQRVDKFENQLIPRIQQIEDTFSSFSDPAFQVLLRKAQLTAACTDREGDYKLLSELLVHRVKNKTNVKKKASITKAVEIIDQIDDDALIALTVFHVIEQFVPTSWNIDEGLNLLDDLYSKLDLDNLPHNFLWMDNLSILGAINTTPFAELKKYEVLLSEKLSGYVCIGIKKESNDYYKAKELLKEHSISESILIENELVPEYLRLAVSSKNSIDNINVLNAQQKDCLRRIFDMYNNDPIIILHAVQIFGEKLDRFPSIKKAKLWWNAINGSICVTSVGRVIAHTNVKSIDNSLPDLD